MMLSLFSLCAGDIARMSDEAAVEAMTVAREVICRAQAIQVHAIARLCTIRGHTRWVAEEVALELSVPAHAAAGLVGAAEVLTTRLPTLLAAMDNGEVDLRTAGKVCEVTAPLSDEQARAVDERIAGRLAGKHCGQVRRMARDAVCAVDPDGYGQRCRKRREDRRVELIPADEGVASLFAYLPAEIASAIYARVDGIARKLRTKDKDRTLDQLRADVLADLLLGKHEGLPGALAQVYVHVPIDAALGITDTGCHLDGYGPIPGEVARDIINNPTSVWRKVTCDPVSGVVLDVGRTRYRPPAALDEFVRVRDRECQMPGCRRPAHRCDIDHHRDYHRGKNGHTNKKNLTCLCKRHHRLKDIDGWDFGLDEATGELTVRTPTGRYHSNRPEPILKPDVEKNDESTKDTPGDDTQEPPPF